MLCVGTAPGRVPGVCVPTNGSRTTFNNHHTRMHINVYTLTKPHTVHYASIALYTIIINNIPFIPSGFANISNDQSSVFSPLGAIFSKGARFSHTGEQ